LIGLIELWLISILLSGAALSIMIGLIIGRAVSGRRQRARHAERQRLLPLLLASGDKEDALERSKLSGDLLADLAIELIQLVRGEEKNSWWRPRCAPASPGASCCGCAVDPRACGSARRRRWRSSATRKQ
jgi:hypothetical protein